MATGAASVKISLGQALIEITGSEEFVKEYVDKPDRLQVLVNQMQVASAVQQAIADKDKDYAESARDRKQRAMESIQKALEILRDMSPQI